MIPLMGYVNSSLLNLLPFTIPKQYMIFDVLIISESMCVKLMVDEAGTGPGCVNVVTQH